MDIAEHGESYIASLALASLCAVFEDIIPEYQIKRWAEERSVTLSKEVKALRMYESLFLKQYQDFVEVLNRQLTAGNSLALQCACRLLAKHPHFNCTDELLKSVTKHSNLGPELVADAIHGIVMSTNFEQRYKALRAINKILRSLSYKQVPNSLIASLDSIDFSVLDIPKKDRKRSRVETELDRDLEASGQTNDSEVAHANRRDLGEVLGIYLLILKRFLDSHLLSPVLKGLVKLAPLVNVEMVWALLRELLQVIEKGQVAPVHVLECAESCVAIMKQCGESVQLEDRVLTKAVYSCLPVAPLDESTQEQLVSCLSTLILEKRIVAKEVLACFIKRLLLLAPHYETPLLRTFVYFVKCLCCKFPKARALFDDDETEDGRVNPEAQDPYMCDVASISFKGEIQLLKRIVTDTIVQRLLRDIAKSKPEGAMVSPVTYFHTQLADMKKLLG
jgi:nucleolar complex protein 3